MEENTNMVGTARSVVWIGSQEPSFTSPEDTPADTGDAMVTNREIQGVPLRPDTRIVQQGANSGHADDCSECDEQNQFIHCVTMYTRWATEQLLSADIEQIRMAGFKPTEMFEVNSVMQGAEWVHLMAERQGLTGNLNAGMMNIRCPMDSYSTDPRNKRHLRRRRVPSIQLDPAHVGYFSHVARRRRDTTVHPYRCRGV
jgi:hypothetical protein